MGEDMGEPFALRAPIVPEFGKENHVFLAEGCYLFFEPRGKSVEDIWADMRAKLPCARRVQVDGNIGYIAFADPSIEERAIRRLGSAYKLLTVKEWRCRAEARWESKKLVRKTIADTMERIERLRESIESSPSDSAIARARLARESRGLANLERKEQCCLDPYQARAELIQKTLKNNEDEYPPKLRSCLQKVLEDLEAKSIPLLDPSRRYHMIYFGGNAIAASLDHLRFEDFISEGGLRKRNAEPEGLIWFEQPYLTEYPRKKKVISIDADSNDQFTLTQTFKGPHGAPSVDVDLLLDSGSSDPSIRPADLEKLDPNKKLAQRGLRKYETSGGGLTEDPIYYIDVAIRDPQNGVVVRWTRTEVGIEADDGEEPLSGLLVFRKAYTATNPGKPVQLHIGTNKSEIFRNVPSGRGAK